MNKINFENDFVISENAKVRLSHIEFMKSSISKKWPEKFKRFLPWEFLQYIGQKSFKFFVQMKTSKFAFEIYWPLATMTTHLHKNNNPQIFFRHHSISWPSLFLASFCFCNIVRRKQEREHSIPLRWRHFENSIC